MEVNEFYYAEPKQVYEDIRVLDAKEESIQVYIDLMLIIKKCKKLNKLDNEFRDRFRVALRDKGFKDFKGPGKTLNKAWLVKGDMNYPREAVSRLLGFDNFGYEFAVLTSENGWTDKWLGAQGVKLESKAKQEDRSL